MNRRTVNLLHTRACTEIDPRTVIAAISRRKESVNAGRRLGAAGDFEQVLGVPDALLEHPPVAAAARLAALDFLELGLRGLEPRARRGDVDLLRLDGVVDEGDRTVLLHLEEARAGRVLLHLAALEVDAGRARLQRRDERRVPGEHADLAGGAGDDQQHRLALEGSAFGRHEGDVERRVRVGHAYAGTPAVSGSSASAALVGSSFWPLRFVTAMSIVPTM